jgi:hypothetical protein
MRILLIILLSFYAFNSYAQNANNPYSAKEKYVKNKVFSNKYKYKEPTDTAVARKLAEWQKRKFGLMMHWGPYTQWNIIESWRL